MSMLKFLILLLVPTQLWAHARLVFPQPRNNSSSIKNGPCGGLARSLAPTVVQAGSVMTLQWIETIDHPGRYIFSLSTANDQGFNLNVLATIPDLQDGGAGLPHMYTAQITIPNINCPTCTLQLIQSMEENPAAPSYYYSCADLNITQAAVPPPPAPTPTPVPTPGSGGEGIQSSTLAANGAEKVSFGGCGTIKALSPPQGPQALLWWLVALLPLLTWYGLAFTFQQRRRQPN